MMCFGSGLGKLETNYLFPKDDPMKLSFVSKALDCVSRLGLSLVLVLGMAPLTLAEDPVVGDGFRETAEEFVQKAEEAREDGNGAVAEIYDRLAEIKNEAADLADEGEWDEIDWTEYHELNDELWQLLK
jgi:hypothetical protein